MWMLHHSRLSAFIFLLLSVLILWILPVKELNPNVVAFVICLFATLVVAFAFAELFHSLHIDQLKYKYPISGALGIVAGIVVYLSLRDSDFFSLGWVNVYGKDAMLILNIICAVYLFFYKGRKKESE